MKPLTVKIARSQLSYWSVVAQKMQSPRDSVFGSYVWENIQFFRTFILMNKKCKPNG